MASLKTLLWGKANKEGKFPIAFRIIKDRKPTYFYLGHYIEKKDWDERNSKVKKSHPNSTRLNALIAKRLTELNDTLLDLEIEKKDTSSKAIKSTLKSKDATFFVQAEIYLNTLRQHGKYNRVSADEPRINRFKEFTKDTDISFKDITPPLLNRFKSYLKSTRNISERTIMNHLIVIRTIFNQAIKAKVVDSKHYPFGRGNIVIKFPETIKIGLTEDEVKQLEQHEFESGSYLNHARNLWLFSFYFAGMRVSDVLRLRWPDFQNDRLFYSMGKNSKALSLKVPNKSLAIINQYKGLNHKHDLVFPDIQTVDNLKDLQAVQYAIKVADKKLNDALEIIAGELNLTKKLTMHIARHTFGNISGDKIPIQMLQKLYRHSSVITTIGYQANFIHKDADDALNSVVSF